MSRFRVHGVGELGAVARQARIAGGDLVKEMRTGIAKAGPPAKKAVRQHALAKMPTRGGYAATLAKAVRVSVKVDTGLTTASVTIKTYAVGEARRRDIPAINKGRLRRKVWGHRDRWVTQRVPAGFWDDAMDETSDDAHQRVRDVLDATIKKLKG